MGGEKPEARGMIVAIGIASALIVAAGAVLVDPGSAQQASSPQQAPVAPVPAPNITAAQTYAPPLAQGPAPDLDLVFTAQVIGWIEPCG